jgi:NodT family efflux transporter outer membrane factor (OMF) lipoprotein
MRFPALAMLATALALAGCMTPPREMLREQPIEAAALGLGSDNAPSADATWWNAYDDAQLDRLMQQALAGNPTLGQALARVRAAQAQAELAGAKIGPDVTVDGQATRQRFSRDDVIPPPYAGGVHTEGRVGLNLAWDLDFWGRQQALVQQAQSKVLAANLDVAGARLALVGAVLQSYIDLDRQYALADLAQRSVTQHEQMLELSRRRVNAGLDTKVELRQAEGAVPQAKVELRQTQENLARATHRLSALSAQGADTYADLERPRWQLDAALPLPQDLPADLLGRRPDILAARSRVEAATSGQSAARAAFYPDVSLSAFVGTAAIGASNLFKAASGTYGVGPAIHLPLFDGGRLKAEFRGATADIDARIADYNDAVLNAVRDVSDQLTRLSALSDERGQQQLALDAAEAAYQLASERYRAGLANQLTVLSAETQVLAARRQRVDLASAQASARVALLLAVGGHFQPEAATPTAGIH